MLNIAIFCQAKYRSSQQEYVEEREYNNGQHDKIQRIEKREQRLVKDREKSKILQQLAVSERKG